MPVSQYNAKLLILISTADRYMLLVLVNPFSNVSNTAINADSKCSSVRSTIAYMTTSGFLGKISTS